MNPCEDSVLSDVTLGHAGSGVLVTSKREHFLLEGQTDVTLNRRRALWPSTHASCYL